MTYYLVERETSDKYLLKDINVGTGNVIIEDESGKEYHILLSYMSSHFDLKYRMYMEVFEK